MSKHKVGSEIRKLVANDGWTSEQKTKRMEVRSGNKNVYHGIRIKCLVE